MNRAELKEMFKMLLMESGSEFSVPIERITSVLTTFYYPFKDGHLHKGLQNDAESFLKPLANDNGELTEDKFIEAMESISPGETPESDYEDFLHKVFRKYDKDKDNELSEQEAMDLFSKLFEGKPSQSDLRSLISKCTRNGGFTFDVFRTLCKGELQ